MWSKITMAIHGLSSVLAIGSLAAPGPAVPFEERGDPAKVLLVGDSIGVGMKPFLGEMITDREVTFDVRGGRTTPQGMQALRGDLRHIAPQTVVLMLGTNDGASAGTFADRIRRTLAVLPADACVIWPAIVRPRRKGAYAGLNRALRRAARSDRRLTVLNYDRMVAKGAVALPDGLHPDHEGYRFLSHVTAATVQRGCSAEPPA